MFPKFFSFKVPEFLQGFLPEQLTIYSYGLMIGIGVLVSFFVSLKLAKKKGYNIDSDQLSGLFLWVILAAFVGGKLFFYFEDFQKYWNEPSLMLELSGGGFVFYGSLIFSIPVIILWVRNKKLPVRGFLDIIAFIAPLLQSFGRVGCFLAGCCHGEVCHNALGVTFTDPDSLAKPLNVPLYPTQLFDIGINLSIILFLLWFRKRQQFEGQLMLIYIALYAVGRSVNELFRGDEERGYIFDGLLSHSQFIAVVLFVIVVFIWNRWKKKSEVMI
jgi:phosphatidylglycerol:prolipoprotein diacylglycerol transferase